MENNKSIFLVLAVTAAALMVNLFTSQVPAQATCTTGNQLSCTGSELSDLTITNILRAGSLGLNLGAAAPAATLDVNGNIRATEICTNAGQCLSSLSGVGLKERIVQKVTREWTYPGSSCVNLGADPTDGDACGNDFYQCTRNDALSNATYEDKFGNTGWSAIDLIECSLEYTTDSSNSFQIELNDPSNTNWTCGDYNLYDFCGDEDGCRGIYYGLAKPNYQDQVAVIPFQIFMEQPGWSQNNGAGVYGWTRQDGGDYGWVNGDGTGDNLMNPWAWTYLQNYRWSACGGDNTTFSDPYVFRFTSHPHIHSKYIIYDQP